MTKLSARGKFLNASSAMYGTFAFTVTVLVILCEGANKVARACL